jgi:CBS domain containing-hemolysin-like protein
VNGVFIGAFFYLALALTASAFFSATEMAILASNRYTLRRFQRTGARSAGRALQILAQRNERLATNLVGNNLFNVSAAAVATYLAEETLGPGWISFLVTTLGMTSLLLVAGEIVPKVYTRQKPETILSSSAWTLDLVHLFFLPVTKGLSLYIDGVLRVIGRKERGSILSREELKALLRETHGEVGPLLRERKMVHSILELRDTVAREVMIPMARVTAIDRHAGLDQWRQLVRRFGHTRIPVYEDRIDRVIGVVNIYDLYAETNEGGTVEAYMRPVPIVPETKRIDRLLLEMQGGHDQMVIVVNEFGSCIGIVTIEDIVEEIVGEMVDEHEAEVRRIRRVAPLTYIVDALTDIDDLNEELGIQLPMERYDTLGGLVLKRFGRIPKVGETFSFRGLIFEVMDVYRYGVRSVKMTLPAEGKEEGP